MRRAVPSYLISAIGDRDAEQANEIPPGHRFLLYFHALADSETSEAPASWTPVKTRRRDALQAVAKTGRKASEILAALADRQNGVFPDNGWQRPTELTSPLFTGGGNPHPVENGFAFLSPYGVPYLAGSGIKGVLRRAAEELALLWDESRGWTLPLVWAVFGFDENSGCFTRKEESQWAEAYERFIGLTRQGGDPVLQQLLEIWFEPEKRPKDQATFLQELRQRSDLRRSIHFQGLVAFWDSFPDARSEMGVDILNPHHRNYYQGGAHNSPHDAEQPVPAFFLVIQPGAKFVLRASPLPGKDRLLADLPDWRKLLDAAFDHAAQWLGFGAKTSVGYGALGPDRKALEEAQRKAREEKERARRQAEEEARRAAEEAQRRAQEEQERKRREAEEAEKARRQAIFDALPENEKIKTRLQEALQAYLKQSEAEKKRARADLNGAINKAIAEAAGLARADWREDVAACIEKIYAQVGWTDPGVKKKKKEKQESKRRQALEALRAGRE